MHSQNFIIIHHVLCCFDNSPVKTSHCFSIDTTYFLGNKFLGSNLVSINQICGYLFEKVKPGAQLPFQYTEQIQLASPVFLSKLISRRLSSFKHRGKPSHVFHRNRCCDCYFPNGYSSNLSASPKITGQLLLVCSRVSILLSIQTEQQLNADSFVILPKCFTSQQLYMGMSARINVPKQKHNLRVKTEYLSWESMNATDVFDQPDKS